jgi:acetyl-CoA carboxylase biotin carboxyl carrier protein
MADKKKKGTPVASTSTSEVRVEGRTSLDVEALRQLVEVIEASEITRLVWQNGDERLSIRRGPPAPVVHQMAAPVGPAVHVMQSAPAHHAPSSPAPATHAEVRPRPSAPTKAAPVADAGKGHVITSPFVGTFYRTPAPDQPPYTEVGATVKKGQVLCIVEAMKLMNEIESEMAGKVTEILVQNGTPVEFGQPLFRLEPV